MRGYPGLSVDAYNQGGSLRRRAMRAPQPRSLIRGPAAGRSDAGVTVWLGARIVGAGGKPAELVIRSLPAEECIQMFPA